MPTTGMDRMPGSGLARGTLFDKELNVTNIDVPDIVLRGSLIFEKDGEDRITISWTSPANNKNLYLRGMDANNDYFVFEAATQTLAAKTLTSPTINGGTATALTDLDMTVGNKTILDTIGSNTLTIGANGTTVSIPGNLTIAGTTTTVNTTTLNVADNLFYLNSDFTGSATEDSGFVIERGDDTNVALVWDESADQFIFVTTNNTGSGNNITEIAYANLQLANLTAAQIGAYTLSGKITAGSSEIEGSNFDIDGGDIASGTTINKSPVITLAGDLSGNATLSTLGNATLTATIVADAVALTTDTTGDYVATAQGTSNEVEVTGSGTEGRAITIGLPNDVTIAGDLTVSGTMTTVNTATMNVADKLIELATGTSGTPSGDSGIVIERGSSANAIMIWDESADKFVFGTTSATGASSGDLTVTSGTVVAALFEGALTGDVTGNITGTAPAGTLTGNTLASGVTASSLTSVGTLTALQVDNLNVNGNTITATSGAVNITPAGGSAIVLDGTINVDAGVVTGATSITSTAFVGALTGTATNATNVIAAANSENENQFIAFVDNSNATAQQVLYDTDFVYNPSSNTLTVPNLNVSGTTTTVSTTDLAVEDEIIMLAAEQTTGTNTDALDVGIASPYRVSGGTRYRGMFYDLSTTRWKFFNRTGNSDAVPGTSNIINTTSGFALGDLEVGNIYGTLRTVAQGYITSVGILTALQVDNLNINGNTISSTAGTDLLITPLAGQQIVLDGTIIIDAGVVTGATSITSTNFVGAIDGILGGNTPAAITATTIAGTTGTFSGAITGGGLMTTGGSIVIPNAGNIGSASDTDAIAISSGGVVTMNQIPVFSAGINVSGGTITGTLATAAQTNITSLGPQAANLNMNSNTVYNFTQLSGSASDGPRIAGNETGTATNPVYIIDRGTMTTGIGGTSTYVSSVIGGSEKFRAASTNHSYANLDLNANGIYNVGQTAGNWTDGSLVVLGSTNSFVDIKKADGGTGNLRFMNASTEEFRIWLDTAEARLGFSKDGGSSNAMVIQESNGYIGINTNTPKAPLHVAAGPTAANDGQAFGSKNIVLTDAYDSTAQLAITMSNYQACYVKVFITGNWTTVSNGPHYAVAYLGEFFVQRTNNVGNEPGAIIRQIDNTHSGSMSAQIVDVDGSSSGAFLIRFKTSTTESGETAYLNYHIMGQFDSIA